jgi:hypothetical protein
MLIKSREVVMGTAGPESKNFSVGEASSKLLEEINISLRHMLPSKRYGSIAERQILCLW